MGKTKKASVTQQPLAGSSFSNWLKLLLKNGGISHKYLVKAIYVSLVSFLGIPFRIFEKIKFAHEIEGTEINYSPIFIVGHWRSGTTYLHNLLVQDQNLGYVSSFQSFLPEIFLGSSRILKPIMKRLWPVKRPMDNVAYSPDCPEEEEYAMGNMFSLSFYHGLYFPKNMRQYFRRSVLLEDISELEKNQWKDVYIEILKKITIRYNGKRIVIKNPANTARIKVLLSLFPEAKFIHIYRNPYTVYASTKLFYEKLLPHYAFQDITDAEIEENILIFYQQIMAEYFDSVHAIPPGNIVEIKFENFEGNEIEEIRRIYNQLDLPGFEEAQYHINQHIDSQSNYIRNKYCLDQTTKDKISKNWKFAFEKMQYPSDSF